MNLETARTFLGWCSVFHIVILSIWATMFMLGHGWMYRLHGKLFPMPEPTFNAIHYAGIGIYKVFAITFAFVPWLVLRMMS